MSGINIAGQPGPLHAVTHAPLSLHPLRRGPERDQRPRGTQHPRIRQRRGCVRGCKRKLAAFYAGQSGTTSWTLKVFVTSRVVSRIRVPKTRLHRLRSGRQEDDPLHHAQLDALRVIHQTRRGGAVPQSDRSASQHRCHREASRTDRFLVDGLDPLSAPGANKLT